MTNEKPNKRKCKDIPPSALSQIQIKYDKLARIRADILEYTSDQREVDNVKLDDLAVRYIVEPIDIELERLAALASETKATDVRDLKAKSRIALLVTDEEGFRRLAQSVLRDIGRVL